MTLLAPLVQVLAAFTATILAIACAVGFIHTRREKRNSE
jgi:hypothetical protein